MTVEREFGSIMFCCDDCGEEMSTCCSDFSEALAEFNSAGWRSVKDEDDEWHHLCDNCVKKLDGVEQEDTDEE